MALVWFNFKSFFFKFSVKPRLIRSSPLQHKINLGSDLRLECNFIGNPKPVVRWVFVDSIKKELVYLNSVPENPGLLHIKNISYTNEGSFFFVCFKLIGIS